MISQIAVAWRLVSRRDRRLWLATVPLAVFAAFLETGGTAAVYGLVKLLGDPTQIERVPMLAHLASLLPWTGPHVVVFAATLFVALLYLTKNGALSLLAWIVSKASAESWSSLSQRLLRGYLGAPYVFHLQRNSAELVNSAIEAADIVFRLVVGPVVAMLAETLVVAGVVVVLLLTAPGVTIVAVLALFGVLAVLVRTSRNALTRWGTTEHTMRQSVLKTLQQTLEGYKEVKLRGREEFFRKRFAEQHDAMSSVRHHFTTLTGISRLFVETVFIIGLLAVVVLVTLGSGNATDLVPVLGVYAYAGFRVIPSVNRILLCINSIRYGLPSVRSVQHDLKACGNNPRDDSDGPQPQLEFHDRIEIQELSYSYPSSPRPVLNQVTLRIHCGESIGIVGPTGAGKSTLVNLILGLLTPVRGEITVDGVDIQATLRSWQSKIGYVPQNVYLMDDTLRRNVAFALADEEIDETSIKIAVERAQLGPFLATLSQGLDTIIGERGVRLSGGERQRVAIARALYYEPELLIFDEATSALDVRTERELTRAIESLHGQKSMLIIAHRLSTVRNCDRLVFLSGGNVIAVGSYDELLSTCLEFRRMAVGRKADDEPTTTDTA